MTVANWALAALATNAFVWLGSILVARALPGFGKWPGYWLAITALATLMPILAFILASTAPLQLWDELFPVMPAAGVSGLDQLRTAVATLDQQRYAYPLEPGIIVTFSVGLALSLARLIMAIFRIRRVVLSATPYGATETGIAIRLTREPCTAFAVGGANPAIVLPALMTSQLTAQQMRCVVRHEAAHINRRDPELLLVLELVRAIYWWSPFVHRLIKRWRDTSELACDAVALTDATPQIRTEYAQTLLRALSIPADRARQCPAASFSTHRLRSEKMRIAHIVNGTGASDKQRWHALILAVIAATLGGTGSLALAQSVAPSLAPTIGSGQTKANPGMRGAPLAAVVQGPMTSSYGMARDVFDGGMKLHTGIDIKAAVGTPIHSPSDAVVVVATDNYQDNPAWGKVVVLDMGDGSSLLFAHLDSIDVAAGDRVRIGQVVARVGMTGRTRGPHVHIETYQFGERVNPEAVFFMGL